MLSKGSTKTRMVSVPVSIAGLSESGGSAKSQENPALTLLLSSGNAGSCCKGWYPCFCDGLSYFLRLCRIRFASPAPGEREGKIRSLYTGILDSFLSKLHSGRNDRDIHDRGEIESFHGKRPLFSLHTFILHKPLLFTTSPQKIFYISVRILGRIRKSGKAGPYSPDRLFCFMSAYDIFLFSFYKALEVVCHNGGSSFHGFFRVKSYMGRKDGVRGGKEGIVFG